MLLSLRLQCQALSSSHPKRPVPCLQVLIGSYGPECQPNKKLMPSKQYCRGFTGTISHALWPLCFTAITLAPSPAQADSRNTFDHNSPNWLRAVGKLQIPGVKFNHGRAQNHREDCSATLVVKSSTAQENRQGANTIITAWHCLEYYSDLSKEITFTLLYGTPDSFSTRATRLSDGGGMRGDWAVLRLVNAVPISKVAGLVVHPGRANPNKDITMAGYSRSTTNKRLSYDLACSITTQAQGRGPSATNCNALKGASGGAVIQLSDEGKPLLAGVISQGNSESLSLFVPVSNFRPAIREGLR